jgi:hypothetical protein
MRLQDCLTTKRLLEVFSEEIVGKRGKVIDTFDDEKRLFGGVAMKGTEEGVWLHPYVYRLVCRNGAIMAEAVESREITGIYIGGPEAGLSDLRETVRTCCTVEAFATSVEQMSSRELHEVNHTLNVMAFFGSHGGLRGGVLAQIMNRFFRERGRTGFDLMNAVTAVARDTRDPEVRWNLEKLGGGVPVEMLRREPRVPPAEARRERAGVGVT